MKLFVFQPSKYEPALEQFLTTDRCRSLGEGDPDHSMRVKLESLTTDDLFESVEITDQTMASGCLAGLWLLYDFLDESHHISQGISGPAGSFWHGIMHRREGDFSNAKYWFRNVGYHPTYDALSEAAAELAQNYHATGVLSTNQWDPMAFVDACQSAVRRGEHQEYCQAVQQLEWELLFDYCYQQAIA